MNKNDLKIIKLLYENREGLRSKTLGNLTGLKRSTLYKRLDILKNKGLVYNEFPLWKIVNGQVQFCRHLLDSKDIYELHNVSYVIKLIEVPKWWNTRKNRLLRLKNYQIKSVDWGKNSKNPFIQLSNDKYVIQTYPQSIIIIHRKRYYSNDPYDVAIQFLQDFYDLWEWFEQRMKFKFFKEGVPQMTLRGNHFNRINDAIANKVKELDTKFMVEIGKNRKVWVDLSEPFGKEANYPRGQEILEKHTKDLLLNKPMLNSELQNLVKDVTSNQLMFKQNIESHVESIKKLGNSAEANSITTEFLAEKVSQLSEQINEMNEILKNIKK